MVNIPVSLTNMTQSYQLDETSSILDTKQARCAGLDVKTPFANGRVGSGSWFLSLNGVAADQLLRFPAQVYGEGITVSNPIFQGLQYVIIKIPAQAFLFILFT